MKGVIFNLLEQLVTDSRGEEEWDDLLDTAGLDGVYTSLGSYPDEQLVALLMTAGDRWDLPVQDLLRWFGRNALPVLASYYPTFFEGHRTLPSFLATINDVVHAEVVKLYPDAVVPTFGFEPGPEGSLRLVYTSGRRLCGLAEGFIEGAAAHFAETVTIDQPECMLRGDSRCVLDCRTGDAGTG
jgi:hypothetical protein